MGVWVYFAEREEKYRAQRIVAPKPLSLLIVKRRIRLFGRVRTNYISWHSRLRTEGFYWSKVLLPHALADNN